MSVVVPLIPLRIVKPPVLPTEHEKFDNSGRWFLEMNRWFVWNLYNTYSSSVTYTQPIGNNNNVTATGSPVSSIISTSIVDEMLVNASYWAGEQENRIYNHMTQSVMGNPLPNIWIKGQEVRQLGGHVLGKCLQMIQPIEKNISCDTISENTLLKKQEVFDKIDFAAKVGGMLAEAGINFNPAGNIDYSNPAAIKEAKKKVKSEYENSATVIARNAYYKTNMSEMFLACASDTIVYNLTGIEFGERNGKLECRQIPGYQAIYDFSTWGEFGEGQTVGGYIVPMTLDDVLHEYPDLDPVARQEIEDVLYKGVDNASQFMDYYNQPFQNVKWWYNDQKWMSKAVVYWLGECDTRYVEKKYSNGLKKVFKLDDYKDYYDPTIDASKLPAGTKMKKGFELRGNSNVWKVHKAVVLGNKYLVEYGYDTYQVRPFGEKSRPILPIQFFCQGKMAGYVKSIVSRIRPKQDELDAVRYRIREYATNDLGANIFVNGAKLTENLSALNLINDMRSVHVSVIPATGDAELDKYGMDDIIKVVETRAAAAIKDYLVLKADIEKEMMDILNIPSAALGEQSAYMGKGVAQQAITRSDISGLPFFTSLGEFYRRCLQYAANKNKMIIMDNENKNVVLPISTREAKILTLTKDFLYEDLNTYISPDDAINNEEMGLFRQMMQSYAQNPTVEHAEALINALKMMRGKSFNEAIVLFETYVDSKRKDDEKKQMQEATQEMQMKAYQNHSDAIDQMQSEIAKLTGKLAEINLKGAWDLKKQEASAGLDTQAKLSDAYIAQITELISKQMAAGQPQQPAQPNQQAA